MKFTDKRLYVLGIGTAYMTDPATGDILFWSDKFREGNVNISASDNVLSAGIGNGPAIIIPTDPNITVNVTAGDYSEYVKAASVGASITPGAPVATCQEVAATGATLSIDVSNGTPVKGPGMSKVVCYVQAIGEKSGVTVGGVAYELDPATGAISGFAATPGTTYLVTYHVAQANATLTTIGSNIKGKVVRFVLSRPIYTSYNPSTNSGDLWGYVHEIIPLLQLMPDGASNSGSQTSYTTTGITGRALMPEHTVVTSDCGDCGFTGLPMMYRIVEPCDPNAAIEGVLVKLGGNITVNVTESYWLTPSLIANGVIRHGMDPQGFAYDSEDWQTATVDENGMVIGLKAGETAILVTYESEDGNTYTDRVTVTVVGEAPADTTLYVSKSASDLTQKLSYGQTAANAVTVDWGDGSAAESSAALTVNLTHEYAEAGDYLVTLQTAGGERVTLGDDNYNVMGANLYKSNSPELIAVWMDGKTDLGAYSFNKCTSLSSVTLPDYISSLGYSSFIGCLSLKSVRFGSGFSNFDNAVFDFCEALIEFDVSEANESYSAENGVLYNKDKTQLVGYPMGLTGDYTVPDNVTSIAQYAFLRSKIDSINLNKTQTVGRYAFSYSSLSEIVWPDGPCDLTAGDTFNRCFNLKYVFVPNSVALGHHTFMGAGLETAVIETGIESIPNYCFSTAQSLANIALPESVSAIGSYCFSQCSGLQEINLPSGVAVIPDHAFYGCSSLKTVNLGAIQTIGVSAFSGCSLLEISEIGANLSEIGAYAFSQCVSMKELTIEAATLQYAAFSKCTGLEKVWLRSSVTSITENVSTRTHGGQTDYNYVSAFSDCKADLVLYAEAASKPSGWAEHFNIYYTTWTEKDYLQVVYGQTTRP